MSLCLLAICLVCSALLAGVYALTAEPIAAAAAAKNEAAIKEVLPETAVAIEEERIVDFEGASYSYNLAYVSQRLWKNSPEQHKGIVFCVKIRSGVSAASPSAVSFHVCLYRRKPLTFNLSIVNW